MIHQQTFAEYLLSALPGARDAVGQIRAESLCHSGADITVRGQSRKQNKRAKRTALRVVINAKRKNAVKREGAEAPGSEDPEAGWTGALRSGEGTAGCSGAEER